MTDHKNRYSNYLSENEENIIQQVECLEIQHSAKAFSKLIGKDILVSAPIVSSITYNQIIDKITSHYILSEIEYTNGFRGSKILAIKEHDIKILTDYLNGVDGSLTDGPITKDHLDTTAEIINQVFQSLAIKLSQKFETYVDISKANTFMVDNKLAKKIFNRNMTFVQVNFQFQIEDVYNSDLMILFSTKTARDFITFTNLTHEIEQNDIPYDDVQEDFPYIQENTIKVSRIHLEEIEDIDSSQHQSPIVFLEDVPMKIKAILGKAIKPVKDVLEMEIGSVIELDRVEGDDVDLLLNGQEMAKGEVIIIDETYGVRITTIDLKV